MKLNVELEELIASPPDKVWKALTDPAQLARWLMPNDFEPRVGKRFTLTADCPAAWEGDVTCEVIELAPPERMVWSWQTSGMERPTRLVFELHPSGSGTRLRLLHTGDADEPIARDLGSGWPKMMQGLAALCH